MMTDLLHVIAGDSIAGKLARHKGAKLEFTYDAQYLTAPASTPLSISMPLRAEPYTDHVINPWLWNLLPDNDAVLDRWSRQFHVSATSAFSLLSTPVGEDCAGAVRFVSPEDTDRALTRDGSVDWLTDNDVAIRLRELRRVPSNWLGTAFTGQFSLAGAQAKTALLYRDGRWGTPHGSTPTTHILKPAIAGFNEYDLNEHLCLDAARRSDLLAVRTGIRQFGDETALVVGRYDRVIRDGYITRVHQEDVCQALGLPPSKKYQNDGGPGVREVATMFRRVMAPPVADEAVARFADALIWNWLIGGTDAHAKNYSLLLSGRQVRLAPLYDVASALPYGVHEKKLRLAMKVGSEYQMNPYRNRWSAAADALSLDAHELTTRVIELGTRAPDAFAEAAKAEEVVALGSDLPGRLTDLVADRAKRCLQLCQDT
jgi:serine/threonine-protein kinase HipA